ncbi:hypothetical protein HCH54_002776 [Aspergillus fumigatus]
MGILARYPTGNAIVGPRGRGKEINGFICCERGKKRKEKKRKEKGKKENEQIHHTQQGIQSCRTLVHFEGKKQAESNAKSDSDKGKDSLNERKVTHTESRSNLETDFDRII